MNVQTSKQKIGSVKPPRSIPSKLSSLGSSLENQEWSSAIDEKRCCDDAKDCSRAESSELEREDRPSIFRSMADYDDQEDMMVLKRANPVYDSDDEDSFAGPAKRQRTSSGESVLQWGARLSEDQSQGFFIHFEQH
jgi:hypothetical protein